MSYNPPQTQVSYPAPPRSSTAHVVTAWIVAVLTAGYMLPWAIAATRNKQNVVSIALVNLFLGWSLVGWIVALVMACSADPAPPTVVVTNTQIGYAPPPGWGYPAQQYPAVQPPYGPVQHPGQPAAMPSAQTYPPTLAPYDPGYEPTRVLPTSQPSAVEVTQPLPLDPWSRENDPYGRGLR